jgi:acyl-CoA thioesterase
LLQDTDVALFTDSTASVEAAAQGIPILHIQSDFLVDINIFEESTVVQSVSSPDQIRSHTDLFCQKKNTYYEEYQKEIRDLFSPVDDMILKQELARIGVS